MKNILFHELAGRELLDARDYYDEMAFGLGKSFIRELERTINIIRKNSLAYPVIRDNIRKALIIKFPYALLYRIEKENIYILSVMHQKRRPNYWVNRNED